MKSLEERRAALEAETAKKRAELEAEEEAAKLCPIEPAWVHFAGKSEPWVTYKAADIPAALEILGAFPVVLGGAAVEAGCLYVGPHAIKKLGDRGKLRFEASELVAVELDHFGRSHRTVEVCWWVPIGEKVARVKVEVSRWPWKLAATCNVFYNGRGEVTSAKHELPDLGEWKRVKWSAGSLESCRFSLYFDSRDKARTWLQGILVTS